MQTDIPRRLGRICAYLRESTFYFLEGALNVKLQGIAFDVRWTIYSSFGVLVPGAAEIIPRLAEKYVLGILSSARLGPGMALRAQLEEDRLLHYFRAAFFSNETGLYKPDAAAFEHLLAALQLPAQAVLYVGDDPVEDIQGAQGAGMPALLFTGVRDLRRQVLAADGVIDHFADLEAWLNE